MRIRQLRLQPDGLPVFHGGAVRLPLGQQDIPKIIVRLRIVRVESEWPLRSSAIAWSYDCVSASTSA